MSLHRHTHLAEDRSKPPPGYEVDTTTFTFTAPSVAAASGHERCIANIDGTSKVSGRDQPNVRQWLLAKLTEPVMEMPLWEFANIFGPGLHMGTDAVTETSAGLNTIEIVITETP